MKIKLLYAAVVLLGAVGGYAYYWFIGCAPGNACPISGNPLISTGYGAIIGAVVGLNFTGRGKKQAESE